MDQPDGTITADEWESSTLESPLARLATEWPWLDIRIRGEGGATEIEVKSGSLLGSVALTHDPYTEGAWIPVGRIGSSGTLTGDVRTARTRARESLAVCDALDAGVSMLMHVRVWWP